MALRVLWVTGNFFPQIGGLEVYIERAISSLADLCSVGLLTEDYQGPPCDERVSHYVVTSLSRPEKEIHWEEAWQQLRQQVEDFAPDIVHFGNAGVAVYRDAIPTEIPVVATVHGNDLTAPWQWVPGQRVADLIVAALSNCDHVFAVSSHTRSLVERFGITAPMSVVAAGCDTDFFRPVEGAGEQVRREYGIPDGRPIVLTVGRLVPRKGHQVILEAIRALPFSVQWVIVGDGPKRDALIDAIKESCISDRITLLGHISDDDLLLLYNACDVFVLTPEERQFKTFVDSEGFGLVFQEAGACGKPVIGSDSSGCRDAVIDGATGLLVPPKNPWALVSAIRQVLENPDLGRRLGEAAWAFVRGSGGWSRFALQTVELYGEIISRRSVPVEPPDSLLSL